MMKRIIVILVILFICPAMYAGSPGTSSALLMISDISARQSSLGGAGGALADDVAALRYNPAGIYGLKQYEIQFTHYSSFEEINYESLIFGLPLNRYDASVGIGIDYLNYGDMPKRNNNGTDMGTFSGNDVLITAVYSKLLKSNISAGFGIKYFSSSIEEEKANAAAIDGGVLYDVNDEVKLGMALQNLGSKLKYISKGEDIPLNFKFSAKYRPSQRFVTPPNIVVDVNIPRGQKINFNIGAELWLNEAVAFRFGYKDKVDEGKLLGGMGFRTDILQLDYAYMWADQLDVAHRISATFRFGGDKTKNQYTDSKNARIKMFSPKIGDQESVINFEQKRRTIQFDNELKDEILFLTPINTIK